MIDDYEPPPPEIVYDGWASWRARLVQAPSLFRRRLGYRFVCERQFARFGWRQESMSRWYADRGACQRDARAWLASKWHDGELV